MTKTKTPTFEDVLEWKGRLRALRGDLSEEQAVAKRMGAELATLYRDGADPETIEKVSRQQAESAAKVEAMKEAILALEANVEEANREACRSAAEEAIGSARRKVGGIAGRFPKDVERAEELVEELAAVLARLTGARDRQLWHVTDAEALAAEFGLGVDVSEFKLLDTGAESRVAQVRAKLANLAEADSFPAANLQGVRVGAAPKAHRTRNALRTWGDESQSADLLERLGRPLSLSTSDLKELEGAMRAHEKELRRERAVEAAAEWLSPHVAGGPASTAELHALARGEDWPGVGGGPGMLPTDRALVLAAERLELNRMKDDSGNHFWARGEPEAHGMRPCTAFD